MGKSRDSAPVSRRGRPRPQPAPPCTGCQRGRVGAAAIPARVSRPAGHGADTGHAHGLPYGRAWRGRPEPPAPPRGFQVCSSYLLQQGMDSGEILARLGASACQVGAPGPGDEGAL